MTQGVVWCGVIIHIIAQYHPFLSNDAQKTFHYAWLGDCPHFDPQLLSSPLMKN